MILNQNLEMTMNPGIEAQLNYQTLACRISHQIKMLML